MPHILFLFKGKIEKGLIAPIREPKSLSLKIH